MNLLKILLKREPANVPHICYTCKYFGYATNKKTLNKGCRYPGKIKVKGGQFGECQMWELQPDPKKRKRSFI